MSIVVWLISTAVLWAVVVSLMNATEAFVHNYAARVVAMICAGVVAGAAKLESVRIFSSIQLTTADSLRLALEAIEMTLFIATHLPGACPVLIDHKRRPCCALASGTARPTDAIYSIELPGL